jgi:uncharacterized protein (DUF924 family)
MQYDHSLDKGTLVNNILKFWFGGTLDEQFQRWFSTGKSQQELDSYIRDNYGFLLESPSEIEDQWNDNIQSFVARIILFDQFSRHIYRDQSNESNKNALKEKDSYALKWSKQLVNDKKDLLFALPMGQFVFSLMPFRHSRIEENLKIVLELLEEREKIENDDIKLLDRFKKTTIRKLYDAESETKQENSNNNNSINTRNNSGDDDEDEEDRKIIEHFPFQANEEFVYREKLFRCIKEFLERKWKKELKYTVVSLSGGVDSMVISKILCLLREKMKYEIYNIMFLFIYVN